MLSLAHQLIQSKKRNELENHLELQILEGTRAFVEETEPVLANLYMAFKIRDFVRKRWDLHGLSTKKVVSTLKQYRVCGERSRPHIDLPEGNSLKKVKVQPVCYSIDRQRLSEIMEQYLNGGERG